MRKKLFKQNRGAFDGINPLIVGVFSFLVLLALTGSLFAATRNNSDDSKCELALGTKSLIGKIGDPGDKGLEFVSNSCTATTTKLPLNQKNNIDDLEFQISEEILKVWIMTGKGTWDHLWADEGLFTKAFRQMIPGVNVDCVTLKYIHIGETDRLDRDFAFKNYDTTGGIPFADLRNYMENTNAKIVSNDDGTIDQFSYVEYIQNFAGSGIFLIPEQDGKIDFNKEYAISVLSPRQGDRFGIDAHDYASTIATTAIMFSTADYAKGKNCMVFTNG